MWHWLVHWLGMDNPSGQIYAAWSGWGGDIGQVGILGAMVGLYRKHTCHVHHCWRLARHPVQGTTYVVCRKHHPDGHLTADHVLAAHHEAKASRVLARPAVTGGKATP